MKINIPKLNSVLRLTKDWKFSVEYERRNDLFFHKHFDLKKDQFISQSWNHSIGKYEPLKVCIRNPKDYYLHDELYEIPNKIEVTLPKETELIVDRIYIRKNADKFDSVTFRIKNCSEIKYNKQRFWVKLDQANEIEYYE